MLHSIGECRWVTSTSHYWLERHGSVTTLDGLTNDGLSIGVVNDGLSIGSNDGISIGDVVEFIVIHILVDSVIKCNRSFSY